MGFNRKSKETIKLGFAVKQVSLPDYQALALVLAFLI